jgi:hypothetical protein
MKDHENLVRFLGEQPNLIVNQGSIRETSIGRNHVSRSQIVELNQDIFQLQFMKETVKLDQTFIKR